MKINRLFRIDFYPQDWIIDTSRLSLEERGIYVQIICLIYANRGEIENDPAWIAGTSGCSPRKAASLIQDLAAKNFLQLKGSKITQKRCENELETKREHLESSARGGRKKAENERKIIEINNIASSDNINSLPSSSPIAIAIERKREINKSKEDLFITPESKKRPKSAMTPLPENWRPLKSHLEKCQTLGLNCEELLFEFKNYHAARATKFASWDHAFFTWISNANKFTARRTNYGSVAAI